MRRLTWLWALLVALAFLVSTTTTVSAATFTYDAPTIARVDVHAIDGVGVGPAQFTGSRHESASPSAEGRGASRIFRRSVNATEAAGEAAGAVTRPGGVADDFVSEVANNGKGTVWRAPGSTGNAGTVRIMEPTAQYPDGYVRFYNDSGQPIGLNGQPGPNSVTHIPLNPDGSYPLPKGWGG